MDPVAKQIILQTLCECDAGVRTLDSATEIDIALTAAGYRIVSVGKRDRVPFQFEETVLA